VSDRPLPLITAINKPFWDACREKRLDLQLCENPACRRYVYYPRVCCPACGCGELKWITVSGAGRIESFTRVYRPQHEAFHQEVPIYFVAVRLNEGPLMYSRIETVDVKQVDLTGRAVKVKFSQEYNSIRLPYFQLQEGES
jgi:uncharacterized protein